MHTKHDTKGTHAERTQRQEGNILIAVLIGILVIGGLSTIMLRRSQRELQATQASAIRTELLMSAEAGLGYNYPKLEDDPTYVVSQTAAYTWDATNKEFVSAMLSLGAQGSTKTQKVQYRIQYLKANVPVVFANRATPTESYDKIKVTSTATVNSQSRTVVAWYEYGASGYSGAIISDKKSTGWSGSKSGAQMGNIVLSGGAGQHAVFGDLRANGEISYNSTKLTNANVHTVMDNFTGSISKNLWGTSDEVPDFTNLGGSDQLFDFDRFEAAAAAGGGQVYTTIAGFVTAMKAANLLGKKLEGITFVKVNPATEGGSPSIDTSDLAAGINITGTLVFRFKDGTDPMYKIFIKTPLNINAGNLAGFVKTDVSTWDSGYPGTYVNAAKKPSAVDISPAFENFKVTDDLPAYMFNNGIIDVHDAANVCGVVYGPSFIEIENKANKLQYFNGMIIGGGGVFLDGSNAAPQAVRYDPNTMKRLATMGGKIQGLKRTGYTVAN